MTLKFKLKVSDKDEAVHLSQSWATKTVSLLDPDNPQFHFGDEDHLVLRFEDAEEQDKGHSWSKDWVFPSSDHLEEVLDFTKDLTEDDNLLVHCHAGVSRSTAVALAVCLQHGCRPKQAFDWVRSVRPQLWPNDFLTKFADEKFFCKGSLVELVQDFKDNDDFKPWDDLR